MTDLELNRALMLTYAGVGAAFIVLGSLIVYTLLIGWLGNMRARRQSARRQTAPTAALSPQPQPPPAATSAAASTATPPPPDLNPQLAAAIAVAVAQAQELRVREMAESAALDREQTALPPSDSTGWKEQGRIAAFDTRRLRDRER